MKKRTSIVGLALAFSLAFSPVSLYAQEQSADTETTPAIYSNLADQKKALSAYPIIATAGFDAYKDETDEGSYVIPGLNGTQTLNDVDEVEMCDQMTPQGVTVADDYIMISAYCHEHKHDSVIYVLNKDDHSYVKTIVLDGKPHAGGIAYDSLNRTLWIATKDEKEHRGGASYIKLSNIDAYDFTKDKAPLKYDYSIEIPQLKDDSFMTYYDSQLYCGYFTKDEGSVKTYIFDIDPQTGKIDTTKRHVAKAYGFDQIGDNCQGIAIDDNSIYLSASDGPKMNSTLSIFKKGEHSLLNSQAEKVITLPPRLEQIYPTGNGGLLTLYESAANHYRDEGSVDIDRVLTMNISDLLK